MAASVMPLAEQERDDLAELLHALEPAEWSEPTLCEGWTVRDVVAHVLSYEERGPANVVRTFARGRGSFDRANDVAMADYAHHGPDELLALLDRSRRPRGLTTMFGGRIALTDGTIHHQDIRRSLGRPRTIPAERLTAVLDFARSAPPLRSSARIRGLRLRATDLDWSTGEGDEVSGPAEALLMAIAGRAAALDELTGPGLATLAARP
ncbi:maleylpyruvate isomerase family mycothiol-dependent enzyme [Actinomycetospora termitidis]|uniref:Maleylpyruvate isomerase family mycothiol-dependent enzyme n=1 Tax=Actinomycetospora termitidis TaxID=3053470 RepID=A0ABT7MFV8_9PSEU|nr:maleylpyruvate isomerase family mycothiol-dependent enzyme [Actinomycetospora sp. Odt1-22]MDL5159555.1 maleylpyruvate isomerase family mycothiol-dependent enzyme [Actinomycetospora sp. Odt1-22]